VRVANELNRLAAVRPLTLQRTEGVVDAAEEDRILRQILATAAPIRGRAGSAGRRRRRTGLLAGGIGLTAAALAAAVVVASGALTVPGRPPAVAYHDSGRLSARQILLAAATAAAAWPEDSGTYWYVKQIWSQPGYQETDEIWTPHSGNPEWIWAGKKTNDRVVKIPVTPGFGLAGAPGTFRQLELMPPQPQRVIKARQRLIKARRSLHGSVPGMVTFGQLQKLPANPAALKAWIVAFNRNFLRNGGGVGPAHLGVFLSLTNLVAVLPAPPGVRAAAFRALATLPDVTSLGPVQGGQGLRLALGGNKHATLVVNTATSQVRDILTVTGVGGEVSRVSVTAHWVNRLP